VKPRWGKFRTLAVSSIFFVKKAFVADVSTCGISFFGFSAGDSREMGRKVK